MRYYKVRDEYDNVGIHQINHYTTKYKGTMVGEQLFTEKELEKNFKNCFVKGKEILFNINTIFETIVTSPKNVKSYSGLRFLKGV